MEKKSEFAISSAKSTETNTLKDMECEKINSALMISPLPNVLMLILLFISTLGIIYAGYIHGNMHLLTTLKNAANP
jgi:hypothetical protein